MRGGFGDVRLIVRQVVVVNPCRASASVTKLAEDVDVGDTTTVRKEVGLAIRISAAGDERMGGAVIEARGSFRGNVNIERGIVFADALPDAFDRELLGITEGREIRVGAERHSGNGGAVEFIVPIRIDDVLAVEVEIE